MADDDVATKAPESDAQESLVAGDTPAQDGPSMGVSIQHTPSHQLSLTGLTRIIV